MRISVLVLLGFFHLSASALSLLDVKQIYDKPLQYNSEKCAVKYNEYTSGIGTVLSQIVITKPGDTDQYSFVSANSTSKDGKLLNSGCVNGDEGFNEIHCIKKTSSDVEGDPSTARCYSYVVDIKVIYHPDDRSYSYHLLRATAYAARGYCDGQPVTPQGRATLKLDCD